MVREDKVELARLKREVAQLRGDLAAIRSALALSPEETLESVAGRIRRQLDAATSTSDQAMANIPVLYQNAVTAINGRPWSALTMPAGAKGTADYRPVSDGSLGLRFALTWKTAPSGPVTVSGIPQQLWPASPWTDGMVSVAMNGLVSLNVTGTAFAGSVVISVS